MLSFFQTATRKASHLWTRPTEAADEVDDSEDESADMVSTSGPLFANCHVLLIESEEFGGDVLAKATSSVKLHGGQIVSQIDEPAELPLSKTTHIIAATHDFRCYDRAVDRLIPIVKPAWMDASIARSRLMQTRQYSPDPRLFMSGVTILTVDLPEGDSEALTGGVLAMGGLSYEKLSPVVTHIVALTMESSICQAAVESKKFNIKIVLPHWFDDCLKLGRRIDERPYCLPDPEILNVQPGVKPRPSPTPFKGSVDPDPSGSAPQVAESRSLTVFARRKVMLCADLGIGSRLKDILLTLIQGSGGQIVHGHRLADMYICKYREGNDYCAASQAGKEVGNLAWLYSLITTDKWTSPMSSLLHYPIAREGLPGLKGKLISLSNYSGDARVYLSNLISVSGAELTKTLKQENTHLLTAHNESEKCAAAREWGVHVVNHLWLEESYAKWTVQPESNSQYTHFPPRTNLGDVVGQTKINRAALEQHFLDEDVEMEDVDRPEPPTFNHGVTVSSTGNTPAHRPKSRQNLAQSANAQTPSIVRQGLGKENQTPSSGARKSKAAASARITSMTPDILQFEKEMRRKGGVVYGGRRKFDQGQTSFERKRQREEEDSDTGSEAKRQNLGAATSMYLMISGYEKWRGNMKVEAHDKNLLRNLGIVITTDAKRATHLAAPSIVRTEKFVTAMAYAPMIISTSFIDECLESEEVLEPSDFLLKDRANEKKYNIALTESINLARKNKNKLLKGQTIFCTENLPGGFDTFKHIIEANGGKCQSFTGRAGTTLPLNRGDDGEDGEVILISVQGQERVSRKFQKMAEDRGRRCAVVCTDWLLDSAMGQVLQATKTFKIKVG